MARRVGIAVALAVGVSAFVYLASIRHGFFDLKVYHGALNYWVNDRGELYDYLKPPTTYGFTYPPFAALTMLPMAYVGWHTAIAISVILTVAAAAVSVWLLVDPIARRHGWVRWFAFAVAACLVAALDPFWETVSFGQVNTLLLLLVAADMLWLVARRSPWAGVGVGLATAIKLTPGIFIVYLLITGRWRAALTASGTAAAATLFAGAVAPAETRTYWIEALWNTDRIGVLSIVSNQSLRGVVSRLGPEHPDRLVWGLLVVAVIAVWAARARAAAAAGDDPTGFALSGVAACLVSPVTWVHHLVWLMPALILLVDRAVSAPAGSRRRRRLMGFAIIAYAVLVSRVVWIWVDGANGFVAFLGSNAYAWASIALLVLLPIRSAGRGGPPEDVADLGQLGQVGRRAAVGPVDPVDPVDPERGPLSVRD